MLYELIHNKQNKPAAKLVRFKATKRYYANDYMISHDGIWKLTYKNKFIMSESHKDFWQIIELYNFKPFVVSDTFGTDNNPVDFFPEDTDTSFQPSVGKDTGTGDNHERPFPIWEWNEYVDESLMPKYKVS